MYSFYYLLGYWKFEFINGLNRLLGKSFCYLMVFRNIFMDILKVCFVNFFYVFFNLIEVNYFIGFENVRIIVDMFIIVNIFKWLF